MKKLITLTAFIFLFTASKAQVELKTNPIALLFQVYPVSLEYVISHDWGSEVDIVATSDGGLIYLNGKYYFSPKVAGDGFNVGAFAGFLSDGSDSTGGLGFMAGYKAISHKNVLFEVALGVGRAFSSDI